MVFLPPPQLWHHPPPPPSLPSPHLTLPPLPPQWALRLSPSVREWILIVVCLSIYQLTSPLSIHPLPKHTHSPTSTNLPHIYCPSPYLLLPLVYLALPDINGEVDELAVFLHQRPQGLWFQKLLCFFLQKQADSCSSFECGSTWVLNDGEFTSARLPDVLLIVIVFGGYNNRVGNCVCAEGGREGGKEGEREEEREGGRKRGRERGRKRGREGERKREMGVRDGGREGGYKGCLDVYGQEKSYPPRKEE